MTAEKHTLEAVEFLNEDGSFSHWSVCECDARGGVRYLSTCVMHDNRVDCELEIAALADMSMSLAAREVDTSSRGGTAA